jgi:hypothetical protein
MHYTPTHIEEFASYSVNPKKIDFLFRFVFPKNPTYEQIASHTPEMYPIFALQSQLKKPPEGEFSVNVDWQATW